MESTSQAGALLARSYTLPHGPRVRLRLSQKRDIPEIRALLDRCGVELGELDLARLIRADPRDTIAITATALVGVKESVLGFGATQVGAETPQLVCADPDGLEELLAGALRARAAAIALRPALGTIASG